MFFNVHTHQTGGNNPFAIVNVHQHFNAIPVNGYYSAGLHPWYLANEDPVDGICQLTAALEKFQVLAVGECGLDKVCKTGYPLQQNCFRQQVQLANQYRKPLILHCVQAYEDTCRILTAEQVQVPVIFHGFNKNRQLARQLVKQGYYLSFGKSLWHESAASVFNDIALNHIFLETDAADMEIADVYARASTIKKITIDGLKAAISANAQLVFGLTIP
jgi:TatD DNase family protein